MRRFLLSSACCCFSLAASAAIITERNDIYNGLGCYAPSQYTFVGSASHPGIESCWIPYGTYTGGSGGTEYLRVTDHLMGVVASALAGFSERAQHSPFMLRPLGIPNRYSYWTDDGAFLESTTNLSLRIADQFNLPLMYVCRDGTNYTYTVMSGTDNCLEDRLLSCAEWFGSRRLESLITAQGHSIEPPISSEWSSILPYNVSDTNLWRYVYPVLGYCTNDIHFLPAGGIGHGNWNAFPYGWGFSSSESIWGNDVVQGYWDVVWGTDGNPLPFTIEDVLSYDTGWKYEFPPELTNDYWTVNGRRLNRDFIDGSWDDLPNSYYALWSFYASNFIYRIYWISPDDWQYEVRTYPEEELVSLTNIRDQPTSTLLYFADGTVATKTDLYADTDDYTHWTNGTTRLDWKRLGIICQLERQMDTTYERLDWTDELPLWNMGTTHYQTYSCIIDIQFPQVDHNQQILDPIENLLNGVSWSKIDDGYSSTTNKEYWSTPTCRTPPPNYVENTLFYGFYGSPIYLDEENAEDMINDMAGTLASRVFESGDVTGEVTIAHMDIVGDWNPAADNRLALTFYGNVGGYGTLETWSNTVSVSSSDGLDDSKWSTQRLDMENWDFTGPNGCAAKVEFLRHGRNLSSSSVSVSYGTMTGSLYYEASMQFDNIERGGVAPSTLVLSATGFDVVSNWVWVVEGDPNMPVYLSSYDAVDGRVTWTFGEYSGGDGNGGYITCWTGRGVMDIHFQYMAGNRQYFCSYDANEIPLSRFWTSGSVEVTWETASETEDLNFHIGRRDKDYGGIVVEWDGIPVYYDLTNDTREVHAYFHKGCEATFTYDDRDAMGDTTNRFAHPESARDWSRIYSMRRSELELLISANGDGSQSSHTLPSGEDSFTWQAIQNLQGSEREFRMLQGATERSQQRSDISRYNLLAGLSSACKRKCREKGGLPIGEIKDIGKITQSEVDAYLDVLKSAKVGGTFRITGVNGFAFEVDIHKEDGRYVIDASAPALPCEVGGCGWACGISYNNSSVTNSYKYKAARADGYQAPVLKTVWKFKNLRDPNL